MTKDEIFDKLKNILIAEFEIDGNLITLESKLFEDLELDSIDAVDLAVKVQQITNKKIPPEKFKEILTVEDVVNTVSELL